MYQRCRSAQIAACLLLMISPAAAGADDCVYRAVRSQCAATISVTSTGDYTIRSNTNECVAVDVQIDGTVYSQKFRGGSLDDKIMLIQKNKTPTAGVNSCTVFENKRQIAQRCGSEATSRYAEFERQKREQTVSGCVKQPTASQTQCLEGGNAAVFGILQNRSDYINACLGEPATEARRSNGNMSIGYKPEYKGSYTN